MHIHQLHQKYGPVVCLAPNEVSFTSLAAVREIYSSGGSGFDKTGLYTLFMQFGTRSVGIYYLAPFENKRRGKQREEEKGLREMGVRRG